MNFKKTILLLLASLVVTLSSWKLMEDNKNYLINLHSGTSKLKATMIEYNTESKKAFTTAADLVVGVKTGKVSEIVSFNSTGVTSKINALYYWLKMNRFKLHKKFGTLSELAQLAQNKADLKDISYKLSLVDKNINKIGIKKKVYRNKIRTDIEDIQNEIQKVMNTKVTSGGVVSLLEKLEDHVRSLRVKRKVVMSQVEGVANLQPQIWGNLALALMGVGFIVALFFALKRKTPIIREEKVIINKAQAEEIPPSEAIGWVFQGTKYPVIICDMNYKIEWKNKAARVKKINEKSFRDIVSGITSGGKGLSVVEYLDQFYSFSINEIKTEDEGKKFLIQLIPVEKPVYFNSNILDKSVVQYVRQNYVQGEDYEVNNFMGELLSKVNFIFQVSATTIDYRPLKEDLLMHVDREALGQGLRALLMEVHNLVKDNKKIKTIGVELSTFNDRVAFSFIIPGFTFSHESWRTFQGENPHSSEQFMAKLNKLETLLLGYKSRINIKNTLYGHQEAGEVCLSVENQAMPVVRKPRASENHASA